MPDSMDQHGETVKNLQRLMAFASVSSTSNRDVSHHVAEQLESIGFDIEITTYFDDQGTEKCNVVAKRLPSGPACSTTGGLAYFGHTDVVPVNDWVGPPSQVASDPFEATFHQDRIYGRGSCDMKGSVAAFMTAAAQIDPKLQTQPLWIVCTADEELAFEGARHLVKESTLYRELVEHQPLAIIGEPTELSVVHGHKGITVLHVISRGRAAHSSSDDGINANDAMVPMLNLLRDIARRTRQDSRYHDSRFDPPHVSWNYGVSDFMTAVNITPPKAVAWISFRTMPGIDGEDLIEEVQTNADRLGLEVRRFPGGSPVWVEPTEAFVKELAQITESNPHVVCYGTDGGEFAEIERRVVIGPGNIQQAHTADEWISLDQLAKGTQLYADLISRYGCR